MDDNVNDVVYKNIPKGTYIGSQTKTGKSGVSFKIGWILDLSKNVIRATIFDTKLLNYLKSV